MFETENAATGKGFTTTVTWSLSEQPSAFVSVTVYVVVTAGETVGLAEVPKPLLHVMAAPVPPCTMVGEPPI